MATAGGGYKVTPELSVEMDLQRLHLDPDPVKKRIPAKRLGVPDGQANSSFNIALALSESGKNEEATKAIENTITLCRNLLKEHPDNAEVQRREASSLLLKATWLRQSRKVDEAAAALKRSRANAYLNNPDLVKFAEENRARLERF